MPDQLNDTMAEATRLTRAGRVAEATALIQRSLGSRPGPDPTAASSAPGRPRPGAGTRLSQDDVTVASYLEATGRWAR